MFEDRLAPLDDPGNGGTIAPGYSMYCEMVSTGADTRVLADPVYEGQRLALTSKSFVTSVALTTTNALGLASHTDGTVYKTCTFQYLHDCIMFTAVRIAGVLVWRPINTTGPSPAFSA